MSRVASWRQDSPLLHLPEYKEQLARGSKSTIPAELVELTAEEEEILATTPLPETDEKDKFSLLTALFDSKQFKRKPLERNLAPPVQTHLNDSTFGEDVFLISVAITDPRRPLKMCEYIFTSAQELSCLADVIFCLKNEDLKSSFLFVENTFYNDLRSLDCIDYSEPIREWLRGNANVSSMSATKFEQISMRLFHPYVFCHQGSCEHIFFFTDVRPLHAHDSRHISAYPKLLFQGRMRLRKCHICKIHTASFKTTDDAEMATNPCYLCEQCYAPTHLDAQGQKLYEFTVEKYYHE